MSARNVEYIKERVEALAGRSRYGFSGEKPLALWAMVLEVQQGGPASDGLEILAVRRDGAKQGFLRLAGQFGRLKDPRSSWSVITGSQRELQRVLESDPATNAAFRELSSLDIADLDTWFRRQAQIAHDAPATQLARPAEATRGSRTRTPTPNAGDRWTIRHDDRTVEAWADFRLPFEPQGEQLAYREALKHAIAQLHARSPRFIHAEYIGPELPGNCDVENVLFYNVGAAAFRPFAVDGLSFSYRSAKVPPDPSGTRREHYVRYRMPESRDALTEACSGKTVVEFDGIRIRKLNSSSKPYELWRDIQTHLDALRSCGQADLTRRYFAITVKVHWPASKPLGLAGVIKPLFDAAVSAFHSCQTVDPHVAELVAKQVGVEQRTAQRWLTRRCPASVSQKCPVELYRGSVRWHPDDSRLRSGCVLVDQQTAAADPSLEITLHSLA